MNHDHLGPPAMVDPFARAVSAARKGRPAIKIITNYIFPPIPTRQFDWTAVTDDYEGGAPIGYGETEAAAIADLMEQLEDAIPDPLDRQEAGEIAAE